MRIGIEGKTWEVQPDKAMRCGMTAPAYRQFQIMIDRFRRMSECPYSTVIQDEIICECPAPCEDGLAILDTTTVAHSPHNQGEKR